MSAALHDQMIITGVTVLSCLAVGAAALVALRLLRRTSIRYQVIIAVLTPVLAVGLTVVLNVRLMFLSAHDSGVMMLALTVSLILASGLAVIITRRITVAVSRLGAGISGLATDPGARGPGQLEPAGQLPAELADLLAELDNTRARLATASAREHAAQEARQQLVRHLSHDLRTPLAGLRAMSEALEDDVVTDVPAAMRQIRATVGRMDSLVGDLFELSRVQGGLTERERKLLSVEELIMDLTDEAETAARRVGVALKVSVPASDHLPITGYADDLARALGNLISNAVRHTAAGGTVAVSAQRRDETIAIAVTDGCGGIPEADLARVFDAGWRGDRSRTNPDGAGLGLAIARGVVEAHQGRIGVSNTAGGCRFDVELPGSATRPQSLPHRPTAAL